MKNKCGGQCSLLEVDAIKRVSDLDILKRSIESASILCEVENPVVVIHPSDDFSVLNDSYDCQKIDYKVFIRL